LSVGRVTGVGGGGVGGGVGGVTLARTGFDAWVLALIGGFSLAGGLGLFAAQRRGRLNA
jgi:LPXTG-motif cell wall-anchored protein